MSQPSPAQRVASRLEELPDACRALLAALERQATRGGGDVVVRLRVARSGIVEAVEVMTLYSKTG